MQGDRVCFAARAREWRRARRHPSELGRDSVRHWAACLWVLAPVRPHTLSYALTFAASPTDSREFTLHPSCWFNTRAGMHQRTERAISNQTETAPTFEPAFRVSLRRQCGNTHGFVVRAWIRLQVECLNPFRFCDLGCPAPWHLGVFQFSLLFSPPPSFPTRFLVRSTRPPGMPNGAQGLRIPLLAPVVVVPVLAPDGRLL